MKRYALILCLVVALPALLCAQQKPLFAEWDFVRQNKSTATGGDFLQEGRYHATRGADAWISFESIRSSASPFLSKDSEPSCACTTVGDCWVVEMPVKELDKGALVDVVVPLQTLPNEESHRFVAEYRDGKQWRPIIPVGEDGANYATAPVKRYGQFWHSFRLEKPIKRGTIAVRLRQIDDEVERSFIARRTFHAQIICHPEVEVRDTTRVLFLGNSYTFYNTLPYIFKQMALRAGHYTDCVVSVVGGYSMEQHRVLGPTIEKVEAGGYDYAVLQEQSYELVFTDTEDDMGRMEQMGEMVAFVRQHNPKVQPVISLTWGRKTGSNTLRKNAQLLVDKYPQFFGSYEAMQSRLNEMVALQSRRFDTKVALQGAAWQIVRRERPDLVLYTNDGSHPSYTGSYLAAAVTYLTLFPEPFGADSFDGFLAPEVAAYLRSVAERVVLKGEHSVPIK